MPVRKGETMTIEHWVSDDGRRAIGKTGLPTTMPGGWAEYFAGFRDSPWPPDCPYALAALRDHAREWLECHLCYLQPCGMPLLGDYDAALIAAVLAVGGE